MSDTALTAILPLALLVSAFEAVKTELVIVVAAPVIVACLLLSCVWIALVTPYK